MIAKQQLDTQAAQVGQFEGSIEADQAAIENAKLQLELHARSPRRSAAASDCARWMSATSCTPAIRTASR